MITSLFEPYLRFKRSIILLQTKIISMSSCSSTNTWKPWRSVRLDLIFRISNIYINSNLKTLIKFTSSSTSTDFKDFPPPNISQVTTRSIPISTRIVISYAIKQGIPFWVWWKANGNWDSNMIKFSQFRESYCETNTRVRRGKKIQKK